MLKKAVILCRVAPDGFADDGGQEFGRCHVCVLVMKSI